MLVELPHKSKKGLLFACSCGAQFLRHTNLLNHLEFGKHQSHPWKMTSIDLSLKYYQRCLEDTIQVKSLIPLQDIAEMIFDKAIPALEMGWALRGAKKSLPLPQKAKDHIQAFFLEKAKIGKRAEYGEAYRSMVADPSIPLEHRLTKEQVKRYISRLVATPVTQNVVIRAKRSSDMEMDDEGNVVVWKIEEMDEPGEWEEEPACDDEDVGTLDDADEYINYWRKNKKTLDIFL